jgi:hypothetical protein
MKQELRKEVEDLLAMIARQDELLSQEDNDGPLDEAEEDELSDLSDGNILVEAEILFNKLLTEG